jgi:hypothetical protein
MKISTRLRTRMLFWLFEADVTVLRTQSSTEQTFRGGAVVSGMDLWRINLQCELTSVDMVYSGGSTMSKSIRGHATSICVSNVNLHPPFEAPCLSSLLWCYRLSSLVPWEVLANTSRLTAVMDATILPSVVVYRRINSRRTTQVITSATTFRREIISVALRDPCQTFLPRRTPMAPAIATQFSRMNSARISKMPIR